MGHAESENVPCGLTKWLKLAKSTTGIRYFTVGTKLFPRTLCRQGGRQHGIFSKVLLR